MLMQAAHRQVALLSKVCRCLDTERRLEYETLKKGEGQERPRHRHINASRAAASVVFSLENQIRGGFGNRISK